MPVNTPLEIELGTPLSPLQCLLCCNFSFCWFEIYTQSFEYCLLIGCLLVCGLISAGDIFLLCVLAGNVTEANAAQLKTLNMIALPVRYTDKFYRELIAKAPEDYLKFAFWNGFAVGSVCSRLELGPQEEVKEGEAAVKSCNDKIYIMTIGVIPAYRRRGIGKKNSIAQTALSIMYGYNYFGQCDVI